MLHYSLPAFSKGDVDAFLPGLARSHQLVKKVCQLLSHHLIARENLIFCFSGER